MTRLVHITDLHFGATDPNVVAALTHHINADPPDLVAISGDLTQGARRSEFRAARAFFDGLAAPTLVVPGNHDITPYQLFERFTAPYRRWHQEIHKETQPSWHDDTTAVVGLNTARRAAFNTLDWSRGAVTGTRLRRALRAFDRLGDKVRIVVAHHPLLPPEQEPDGIVVDGARRALQAFAENRVSLVLAGHLHKSYGRLEKPDMPGPLILQGGSATSTRLRGEPNAFNRIDINTDTIAITNVAWSDGRWTTAGRRELPARQDRPGAPPLDPAGVRGPQTPL